MVTKQNVRKGLEIGVSMTAIALLVSGCLGSNSSSDNSTGNNTATNTTTISGVVADGYLKDAKVCLDINSNGACDANEPSGVTNASGVYSFSTSVTSAVAASYSIVAEVPATAVDADTNTAVGTAFTLTSPAGASFVSPLTTLVQDKIAAGATSASAVASVIQALGIPAASGVSVLDDYVAKKGTATDQTNGHFRAHEAAKTVVAVLKAGKTALGSASVGTDKATQSALLGQAEAVLQLQATSNATATATMFSSTAVNSGNLTGVGTLKSQIAAKKANASTATQAVTINFDVLNGSGASIGTTGCAADSLTLGVANASSSVVATGSLKDLRYYVSNVALIDANGNYSSVIMDANANQDSNVALMDFEDASNTCATTGTVATYTAVVGKVAPGNYVGIAFDIGVPGKLNHTDPAAADTPTPLQNSAMNWSWQSGRKFTKIEFTGNAASGAKTTMVHLGATGCKANPTNGDVINGCASPNRMHVSFANFNTTSNKVALDLSSLFGGLDLTASRTWMSGKSGMMAMDATYYFNKLQIDKPTGLPISDGAAQTVFVVK